MYTIFDDFFQIVLWNYSINIRLITFISVLTVNVCIKHWGLLNNEPKFLVHTNH